MGAWAGLDGYRISLLPPGFDPRTVQSLASHYTDYAIRAHTVSPCSVPIFEFVLFGCYSSLIVDSPVMLTVGRNQEDVIDKTVCELRA